MGKLIRDIMQSDPISLDRKSVVLEAARRMKEFDIGSVLVTKDGKLEGIVTDRDVVVRCLADGGDPKKTTLGDLCSSELVTLSPDEDSDRAVKLMHEKAIRRIPVVEGGKPVGIFSIGDLALARDEKSALAGISSAPPNQ